MLTATGGIGAYTFSIAALPAGLTLNPTTGAITGTPAAPIKSFVLTATVNDLWGNSTTASNTIEIKP
jgi:hypothetical protein